MQWKSDLRGEMKRLALIPAVLLFFSSYGLGQQKEKKIMEDGVEVVINHLEPYKVKRRAVSLKLEKKFTIDLERDDLADLGIFEVAGFDVDSEGKIYLVSSRSSGNFIFKFDERGAFIGSFCKQGQGPGEIQAVSYMRINERDEILLANGARDRLVVLNKFGELLKEIPIAYNHVIATLLKSGNILAMKSVRTGLGVIHFPIVICDPDLNEIKTLNPWQKMHNFAMAKELNGLRLVLDYSQWSVSNEFIYIGNQERGYEFLVYDFGGSMIKKIRKEYKQVKVPQQVKEQVLEKAKNNPDVRNKIYFPDYMPPFQYYFTDDIGRLYVMTYEKGERAKEFVFDVFNPDGFFISRIVLDNSGNPLGPAPAWDFPAAWGGPFDARARNNLLYHLRAKASGYQELVVYDMIWK
jgi:hypothetical protein